MLTVHNQIRTYRVDIAAITALELGASSTPLTAARPWPTVVVTSDRHTPIRVIATAGMRQGNADLLIRAIVEHNAAVDVSRDLIEAFY
jgi:hypothetical protein